MKTLDITNKKYGKLTAIKYVRKNKFNVHYWLFKCECGKEKVMQKASVINGFANSCGCGSVKNQFQPTHRMTGTKFYQVWHGIKDRCFNKKDKRYKDYGARGIKCEWKSFEEFYDDMFSTFKRGLTIERINNDGNYCKENCRWATMLEQGNNRRNSVFLTKNGETKTASEWSKLFGFSKNTIYQRLKNNWSIEKVLTPIKL